MNLIGSESSTSGDLAVGAFLAMGAAVLLAWVISPLTREGAKSLLGIELQWKTAWWIGFVSFAACFIVSSITTLPPDTFWFDLCAGALLAAITSPWFARVLPREMGGKSSMSSGTGIVLGTLGALLATIGVLLIVGKLVR